MPPWQDVSSGRGKGIRDFFDHLTDAWWKKVAWLLLALLLVLVFCYITRACYVIWDCANDPYWGCCSTSRKEEAASSSSCERFLLLKCCLEDQPSFNCCGETNSQTSSAAAAYTYQICRNDEPYRQVHSTRLAGNNDDDGVGDIGSSSEINFALGRQDGGGAVNETTTTTDLAMERRWQDTSLTVLSLGNKSQSKQSLAFTTSREPSLPQQQRLKHVKQAMVTSTPKKGPNFQCSPQQEPAALDEYSGEAEALPHLHKGHYFNVFNLLGLGGGRYDYCLTNNTTPLLQLPDADLITQASRSVGKANSSDFDGNRRWWSQHDNDAEEEAVAAAAAKEEQQAENWSLSGSHRNNNNNNSDFLISNSFNNIASRQRYGLHIEEGQTGRYNPLPDAQAQLLPPDKFMQLHPSRALSHKKKKALMASRRRSRSVDTFSKLHGVLPPTLSGSTDFEWSAAKTSRGGRHTAGKSRASKSHTDIHVHQIPIPAPPEDKEEDRNKASNGDSPLPPPSYESSTFPIYSVPNKSLKKNNNSTAEGGKGSEVANNLQTQQKSLGGHGSPKTIMDYHQMEHHLLYGRETKL